MADLVETWVDPDATGDNNGTSLEDAYTSLYLWDNNEQADLPTLDEYHICHVASTEGSADTTEISVAGWDTDATHPITVEVLSAYKHDGKWNSSKARLEISTPTYGALTINEDCVTVIGLQVRAYSVDASSKYTIETTGQTSSNQVNLKSCIFRGPGSDNSTYGFRCVQLYDADDIILLRNCLIYDSGSHDFCYGIMTSGSGVAEVVIQNCTSVYHKKCVYIDSDSGTVTLTNVLASDHLASGYCFLVGGTTVSQNYCASEDDTADNNGGTGNNENISTTNLYADEGNDDFHLQSGTTSDVKDAGTNLSGQFTNDIDGETRPSTWDIGCDEYFAAGEVKSVTGTADLSFGADVGVVRKRGFAGDTALVLGASVEVLRDITLSGASALTFVASIDVARKVALSGAAALQLAASCEMQRRLIFAGSAALQFGADAIMQRKISLNGSSALQLGAACDVTVTAPGISGSAALSIGAAAKVQVKAQLKGTSAMHLGATIGVHKAVTIAGASAMQFGADAHVTVIAPYIDISGSASMTIGASADVRLVISLMAAAAMVLSANCDVTLPTEGLPFRRGRRADDVLGRAEYFFGTG